MGQSDFNITFITQKMLSMLLLSTFFIFAVGQNFRYILTDTDTACKNACLLDQGNLTDILFRKIIILGSKFLFENQN